MEASVPCSKLNLSPFSHFSFCFSIHHVSQPTRNLLTCRPPTCPDHVTSSHNSHREFLFPTSPCRSFLVVSRAGWLLLGISFSLSAFVDSHARTNDHTLTLNERIFTRYKRHIFHEYFSPRVSFTNTILVAEQRQRCGIAGGYTWNATLGRVPSKQLPSSPHQSDAPIVPAHRFDRTLPQPVFLSMKL